MVLKRSKRDLRKFPKDKIIFLGVDPSPNNCGLAWKHDGAYRFRKIGGLHKLEDVLKEIPQLNDPEMFVVCYVERLRTRSGTFAMAYSAATQASKMLRTHFARRNSIVFCQPQEWQKVMHFNAGVDQDAYKKEISKDHRKEADPTKSKSVWVCKHVLGVDPENDFDVADALCISNYAYSREYWRIQK